MPNTELPWVSRLADVRSQAELRRFLVSHWPALERLPERIAVLGAADEGARLASLCDSHGIEVAAIVDDDSARQSKSLGAHCVQPSAALDKLGRDIPVIIASHRTVEASRALKARGFLNVPPFAVLQLLHPETFPPHMFYLGWLEDLWENRRRYADLAQRLTDAQSREVLDAVLGYRQTLDPATLADVVRPHDPYVPNDLFSFGDEEVYVDGGSFDGDTIRLFVDRVAGKYSKVFGFEPDPETFSRLRANFASEPRVVPINAGLWSKTDILRFQSGANRASILDTCGEIEVKVTALDEVLEGERATVVKMNIEGAELQALRGSAATLLRHKPKLAIAVYHRPSDLWEAAEVINEIVPGYEFHLRQHNGGVIETVLYGKHPDAA